MKKSPFVIGLTGTLASGKSAVAQELKKMGCAVLDTDIAVHELQQAGTGVTQEIVDVFGDDILTENGAINREKLGKIIINTPSVLTTLEGIIYPALKVKVQGWLKEVSEAIAVIEAPLLFEATLDTLCSTTVACMCASEIRKQRALLRKNMTLEKYLALSQHQKSNADFAKSCKLQLQTDKPIDETIFQLQQWVADWRL